MNSYQAFRYHWKMSNIMGHRLLAIGTAFLKMLVMYPETNVGSDLLFVEEMCTWYTQIRFYYKNRLLVLKFPVRASVGFLWWYGIQKEIVGSENIDSFFKRRVDTERHLSPIERRKFNFKLRIFMDNYSFTTKLYYCCRIQNAVMWRIYDATK